MEVLVVGWVKCSSEAGQEMSQRLLYTTYKGYPLRKTQVLWSEGPRWRQGWSGLVERGPVTLFCRIVLLEIVENNTSVVIG